MQALQLTDWRHDPSLREVPQPDPGPGQVLVRVGAAGACHSDLHVMHDFDGNVLPWSLPFTLGHENAGWVEALGAGVTGLEVGQPVAVYGAWGCGRCHRCRLGLENYCEAPGATGVVGGLGADGGMAPYLLVPAARHLVPLLDLDPVQAAPLTDAGLTPYHAVKRSLPLLGAGSTAVVIGVGGLGHLAVQILEALCGARVIAVDEREDALALATAAGAEHTVLAGPDAVAEVRGHTPGGRGADVVLDLVGVEATLATAVGVARPLAHVTLVGIGGGAYPFSFFTLPYEVSLATTYWGSLPELVEVVTLAEAGHLTAEVTTYPLADAVSAYRHLAAGEVAGRAVVVP